MGDDRGKLAELSAQHGEKQQVIHSVVPLEVSQCVAQGHFNRAVIYTETSVRT